jgi:hypothetical protein
MGFVGSPAALPPLCVSPGESKTDQPLTLLSALTELEPALLSAGSAAAGRLPPTGSAGSSGTDPQQAPLAM